MSDYNSKNYYLPLKDIFNERLFRDLILFLLLYILIIAQYWENIFLLLFPIITFAVSFFFRIVNTNKWRAEFNDKPIIYNPFGSEKRHANRLFFCSIIQLVLLFWIGSESLYHPLLVNHYFFYFNILYMFSYTFAFFWIFLDLWKFSKMEINLINSDIKFNSFDNIVSYLNLKKFRLISLFTLIIFFALNILNILMIILVNKNVISGIELPLPGTGSEGSEPITISIIPLIIFFLSPVIAVTFLLISYREISNINKNKLNQILNSLPQNLKIKIIENIQFLNNKITRLLDSE